MTITLRPRIVLRQGTEMILCLAVGINQCITTLHGFRGESSLLLSTYWLKNLIGMHWPAGHWYAASARLSGQAGGPSLVDQTTTLPKITSDARGATMKRAAGCSRQVGLAE